MHTALRETHEELGLVVPEDHVWGILQPIYYMVSPPGSEASPALTYSLGRELGPRALGAWSWTCRHGMQWSTSRLPGSHLP